ncbi:hypothetical protein F2Q69_00004429 [Brassica cretica]|uniref:Bet v I/Major latex protein domain-containing protein n=1 Tax=Brassica cretica TaxID=69181 RepID=A0A8S9NQD5_BRACR|nr:hypothetical protein F2Q69_00004429 [Brassica cretica]
MCPKPLRYIQGCDLLEGDWGMVGSIVLWKLISDGETRVSKDRIEAMDFQKKVSPDHGGPGSTVKWNVKYERIDENVAHPERLLQFLVEVTKQVDGYLLSEE